MCACGTQVYYTNATKQHMQDNQTVSGIQSKCQALIIKQKPEQLNILYTQTHTHAHTQTPTNSYTQHTHTQVLQLLIKKITHQLCSSQMTFSVLLVGWPSREQTD